LPSTRAIETRSLPNSLAATHRGFAFYVAFSKSSIPDRTCSMSLIPSAPFTYVSFALPSFQWSPIMHHTRLMMRAKSNGNSKSVSVSSRCNGREATARLSNQVAAATARRIVVGDDVFVLLART